MDFVIFVLTHILLFIFAFLKVLLLFIVLFVLYCMIDKNFSHRLASFLIDLVNRAEEIMKEQDDLESNEDDEDDINDSKL